MTIRPRFPAQALQKAAAAIRAGVPVPAALATWIADALDARATGDQRTIDHAAGLITKGFSWEQRDAQERRDAALCAIANRRWPHLTAADQARELERAIQRFASVTWRKLATRSELPKHASDIDIELFALFEAGRVPRSWKQLNRILSRHSKSAFDVPQEAA